MFGTSKAIFFFVYMFCSEKLPWREDRAGSQEVLGLTCDCEVYIHAVNLRTCISIRVAIALIC
jgi:hypothetical protein